MATREIHTEFADGDVIVMLGDKEKYVVDGIKYYPSYRLKPLDREIDPTKDLPMRDDIGWVDKNYIKVGRAVDGKEVDDND